MSMTHAEKNQLTMSKGRIETLEARVTRLIEERDSANGALSRCTILVEGRMKDNESLQQENIILRQNLERALGYIDRVNEDSPQQPPVVEAPRIYQRSRGPQLNSLGINSASSMFDSCGQEASYNHTRRY